MIGLTPLAQTRRHVMLARQVGSALPSDADRLVETPGHAVVRLDGIAVRGEADAADGKQLVADLTLTVVALEGADTRVEPVELWIEGTTGLDEGR